MFEGENAIVIVKGANEMISNEDLMNAMPAIQNAKVIVCQLEINPIITMETMQIAKSHGGANCFIFYI